MLQSSLLSALMGQMEQVAPTPEWMLYLYLVLVIFTFLISLSRLYAGLILLVVSMLLSPEIIIPWTGTRPLSLRLEDFLMVAIFLAWVTSSIMERRAGLIVRTPLHVPILAYLSVLLLSTFYGYYVLPMKYQPDPKTSAMVFVKVIQFFMVFFITVSIVKTRKMVTQMMLAGVFTAIVVVGYGLVQAFVFDVRRVSTPMESGAPEPNTLGGYLTMAIALGLCILLHAPPRRNDVRLLSGTFVVGAFVVLLYTLSRASYLGILFMLVLLVLMLMIKGNYSNALLLLIGLIVFSLVSPYLAPPEVLERITSTFNPQEARSPLRVEVMGFQFPVDSSTAERITVWQKVWWAFLMGPMIIGYGINFMQMLDSQWARLLVESGLLGIMLFCWILWRIGRMGWVVYSHSDDWFYRAFALGFMISFAGLLVHSLGTITFYIVRIMEPFWFLTGLLAFMYLETQRQREAQLQQQRKTGAAPTSGTAPTGVEAERAWASSQITLPGSR